jgi:integrase/recombinase XerD
VKTYLEPEEIDLMEKAATNIRDRLLIRLLFRLGCRISESLAITVQDIDLQQSTVTIEHLKGCWKQSTHLPGCWLPSLCPRSP